MWCIIYQNFISCLVLSKKLCPTSREQFFFSRSFTVLDCMLRSIICLKEITCGLRVEVYLFPYVKLKYLGIFHWKAFLSPVSFICVHPFWILYVIPFLSFFIIIIFIVVDFVIHWKETAMGLHVFPIPIPPPTSLSTQSL